MMQQIVAVMHQLAAIAALAAWALAMYYWALTNNSLAPGISRLLLLNPLNYARHELFTSAGLKYRRSSMLCFATMFVLAALAFLLGAMRATP